MLPLWESPPGTHSLGPLHLAQPLPGGYLPGPGPMLNFDPGQPIVQKLLRKIPMAKLTHNR